ncbi:type II CAAX endopeptidase family protein [Chroococcidiopsis sp [FACHB-1243]]|uniref:CPBP family intramembrane glutamic endopeptidase n=1 Tax=Chroococcidiopsis sp. [FACHB-1243] TaxID=2692781 RepID=UPI001781C312|nr:type II CAAX endopeptidase family protein [Chroococcidiopsis sp. [FACHB-1243]]
MVKRAAVMFFKKECDRKSQIYLDYFHHIKSSHMLNLPAIDPFLKFKTRNIFILLLILIVEFVFISDLLLLFFNWNSDDPIFYDFIYYLMMLLPSIWILHRFHQLSIHPKYLIGKLPNRDRWLSLCGIAIAICLFTWGIDLLFFYSLSLISPSLTVSLVNWLQDPPASTSALPILAYLTNIISLVVVAPITEEFIFRGVLIHRWAMKWGISPAILVSAIIFGLGHIVPFGAAVFGILMTLLYFKTRSLIVPAIAHAMNNAATIVLEVIFPSQQITTNYNFSEYLHLGIVLIVISAPFVLHFVYTNWYKQQLLLPYFTNAS